MASRGNSDARSRHWRTDNRSRWRSTAKARESLQASDRFRGQRNAVKKCLQRGEHDVDWERVALCRHDRNGYFKFFEYEYTITDLLPTVPYYVNVTAFDFGWPESNLEPLETARTVDAQMVYPSGRKMKSTWG